MCADMQFDGNDSEGESRSYNLGEDDSGGGDKAHEILEYNWLVQKFATVLYEYNFWIKTCAYSVIFLGLISCYPLIGIISGIPMILMGWFLLKAVKNYEEAMESGCFKAFGRSIGLIHKYFKLTLISHAVNVLFAGIL